MKGENWPLVIDEPVEFESNQLKLKISKKSPIILEDLGELYLKVIKENPKNI